MLLIPQRMIYWYPIKYGDVAKFEVNASSTENIAVSRQHTLKSAFQNTKHKLTVMFKQLNLIKTIKNLIYSRDTLEAFPIQPQGFPGRITDLTNPVSISCTQRKNTAKGVNKKISSI